MGFCSGDPTAERDAADGGGPGETAEPPAAAAAARAGELLLGLRHAHLGSQGGAKR